MGLDDFDISRHCRTATAMSLLLEAGVMTSRERARLLGAMWKGWREVMYVKLAATLYCDQQNLQQGRSR